MKVSQKEMFVLIYLRVFPGVFFFSPINHKLSRIPKGKNMLSTLFLPIIHFQNSFPSGHTKKAKSCYRISVFEKRKSCKYSQEVTDCLWRHCKEMGQ